MATYTGSTGGLYMGGVQTGSVAVATAVASGVTTLNVNGYTTIVALVGDTFTVAGETGAPTHTLTADVFVHSSTATATALTFSTAIATGGVAASAVVTFTSNSMAQVANWRVTSALEVADFTSLGDKWARKKGTIAGFSATFDVFYDKGDSKQSALIDRMLAATPTQTSTGFVFKAADDKYLIGYGVLTGLRPIQDRGAILRASCTLTGDNAGPDATGGLRILWN